MPSGHVLGLPKAPQEAAPSWGTVEYVSTGGSWNVSTVTLATPAANEFWVCCTSTSENNYDYIIGTSQHTTQTGEGIIQCHNGTNGWTSALLNILKPRPGATWATTVNLNLASGYLSSSCVRLRYTEGFQVRPYQGVYSQFTSSVNNVTVPVQTNAGPYPGGVCVAFASHEAGSPSGMTGISSASQAAGWTGGTYGGGLSAIAYYILSTATIETPPAPNFTTVYATNCWLGGSAYIR